jgi:hypothetical protein
VNAPFFSADEGKKTDQKWDADSSRYAHKLTAKTKPHCLNLFRHGGFFFARRGSL